MTDGVASLLLIDWFFGSETLAHRPSVSCRELASRAFREELDTIMIVSLFDYCC